MSITHIAGYKFITIKDLSNYKEYFLNKCSDLMLKGTILLSPEGININLAGSQEHIETFKKCLDLDPQFNDISFHYCKTADLPYKVLKVKIKKEIITMNQSKLNVTNQRAPGVTPEQLKEWLDQNRDITLLDTRNDYEVRFGTFRQAINLNIDNFGQFPDTIQTIDKDKPIVMFCTGGIRCEKAALYMLSQGFSNVFQLEGGILGYFNKVGGDHFEGECFVFDNRISVDTDMKPTDTIQCSVCLEAVTKEQQLLPNYISNISCPTCAKN